jgi:hypothetical protein
MLASFDSRYSFGEMLGKVVSASRPIQSVEKLMGREKSLAEIEKALYAPGRHIFVFGDRGVGKSSLAATAAHLYQSSDATPIFVSGSKDDTFKTIVANIVYQALGRTRTSIVKTTKTAGFEWRGLKIGASSEVSWPDIAAQIRSVGDAAELLKEVAQFHSERPIVVIDEFDTIADVDERGKFAALMKLLGDQSVSLKFIFTGIGKSLDELLGAHQSAHRQLLTLELPKLGWDGRRDIVNAATREFGLSVDNDVCWRIAAVSDGYPYYVHLITEHMLWAAFDSPNAIIELSWDQFHAGLNTAVESINAELRKPYEKAVLLRDLEYEDVVWATADAEDLTRSLNDMFASYRNIQNKRSQTQALDRDRFSAMVRKLKQDNFGAILVQETNRPGWYTYREKMLRGYVRMQAEASGVPLRGEREAPRQQMHITNARSGYKGSAAPEGVRTNVEISELRKRRG